MANQQPDAEPQETGGPWSNPPKGGPWELFFVENMRRLREKAKMTQTDLAKALKARGLPFHQPTVQRIENGDRPVRLNEAFAIAEELDCDLGTMTRHLVRQTEDVTLAIERMRGRSTVMIETLLEEYGAYLESVEHFAGEVWDSIPDRATDEHGEPTLSTADHFHSFPDDIKNAVAILVRLDKLAINFEEFLKQLGEFFGDRSGETRSDVWELQFPDEQVVNDIDSLAFNLDCEELQGLSKRSLTAHYIAVLNRSRREAQEVSEGGAEADGDG